jgi:hypothetical protein
MEMFETLKDQVVSSNIIFIVLAVLGLYLAFKILRGIGKIVFTILSILSLMKWVLWLT